MIGNVRRVSVISCRDFIAFRKLRVDMIFDMTSITSLCSGLQDDGHDVNVNVKNIYRRSNGRRRRQKKCYTVSYAAGNSSVFTARCTIVQSAVLRLHVVCLSVTLVDHDHIGWKSWKRIARKISPTPSLVVPKCHPPTPTETWGNFGETRGGVGKASITDSIYTERQ